MTGASPLWLSDEVASALAAGRPVVALESSLIAQGLPAPHNLETAAAAERAVRDEGAVPATVAVDAGRLVVGAPGNVLDRLADLSSGAAKAALATSPRCWRPGGWPPPRSVPRCGSPQWPVSVSWRPEGSAACTAGPQHVRRQQRHRRAGRDLGGRRVQRGQVDPRPARHARAAGDDGASRWSASTSTTCRRSTAAAPASACRIVSTPQRRRRRSSPHLAIPGSGGILFVQPPPVDLAIPPEEVERWIEVATAEASTGGIRGGAVTPFVLGRVAELSDGRTLRANIGLIVDNARMAARIAVAIANPAATASV